MYQTTAGMEGSWGWRCRLGPSFVEVEVEVELCKQADRQFQHGKPLAGSRQASWTDNSGGARGAPPPYMRRRLVNSQHVKWRQIRMRCGSWLNDQHRQRRQVGAHETKEGEMYSETPHSERVCRTPSADGGACGRARVCVSRFVTNQTPGLGLKT